MDITPYTVSYPNNNSVQEAEIRPCCREDNVVDYAIYIKGQLAFTIRKSPEDLGRWIVSLKNADNEIDEAMVQRIGIEIDQYNNKHNQ